MLICPGKSNSEPGYHNPSPLVQLIDHSSEAIVVVVGAETMAMVDTGSQVSTLTEGFYLEVGLTILPLKGLLHLEGTGDILIPYKGYVEAYLIIPGLPLYSKLVLYLVVSDHKYGEQVPVQLGVLVIDHLVATMTTEELQQASETWKQVHSSTILSKGNVVASPNIPKYDLKGVKGKIRTM